MVPVALRPSLKNPLCKEPLAPECYKSGGVKIPGMDAPQSHAISSNQTVNGIENDKYDPMLPLAFKIAKAFRKSIEEVFLPGQKK